ncbi:MAG: hypothetical protein AAF191_02730, partial [Verrucomicrobiota bacterium]
MRGLLLGAFVGLIGSSTMGWAQDRSLDGIPMLVRPGMEVEKEEVELDPNDPLAEEKQRLRDWEDSLNLTADALTERLRLLAERETALVERERTFARREAALESREAALSNRERLVRAREKLPEVRPWAGPRAPSIVGKYAMVIDARNGRILHQKDAYEAIPVASTQKLLTALLVVEAGDLEREIVVEASDTKVEPSVLGFKTGETYTRKELVQWLMVRSGNDVALALARERRRRRRRRREGGEDRRRRRRWQHQEAVRGGRG